MPHSGTKSLNLNNGDYLIPMKNGDKIKETQWHPIVAWGKQAEFADKYIIKGQEVCIEGKLNYRNYEDSDGNKKNVFEYKFRCHYESEEEYFF